MRHIKRIDEINRQMAENKTEYIIINCECIVAEDNYENGETNEHFVNYEPITKKADTLENLMKQFNDEECSGHKFNKEDWAYDIDTPNRLEMTAMGSLINDHVSFQEPSAKEWDDFKQNKCNLTSFVFYLYIEKHEVIDDLTNEFKQLGIESI